MPIYYAADLLNKPKLGLKINHYWSHVFFFLIGIKMDIIQNKKLDKNINYIFCPNHFSFLDIAIMPFLPVPFKYVGKVSIARVPFFGYMFKKFHITVDRAKLRDRYATYTKSLKALLDGFSLTIFPEGGISSLKPPKMARFKEGPFRMALETGVSIVPITLADNWHIFPDDGKFYIRRRKCRMVIHDPINPANYSIDKLKEFQDDVRLLIQTELNKLNQFI
jgi:1-acyl-sn-glycerol-3-phosphate acyltransferase